MNVKRSGPGGGAGGGGGREFFYGQRYARVIRFSERSVQSGLQDHGSKA
jgi:hypothetical protein